MSYSERVCQEASKSRLLTHPPHVPKSLLLLVCVFFLLGRVYKHLARVRGEKTGVVTDTVGERCGSAYRENGGFHAMVPSPLVCGTMLVFHWDERSWTPGE